MGGVNDDSSDEVVILESGGGESADKYNSEDDDIVELVGGDSVDKYDSKDDDKVELVGGDSVDKYDSKDDDIVELVGGDSLDKYDSTDDDFVELGAGTDVATAAAIRKNDADIDEHSKGKFVVVFSDSDGVGGDDEGKAGIKDKSGKVEGNLREVMKAKYVCALEAEPVFKFFVKGILLSPKLAD
ncbi:hypothetical protein FRX31_027919 [Thalictrum thalictroides]|uniref:Uncharacterized protein n=1 Tax=Thalictrum thalictroides TaxID=46969 RepID=A0A7J6VBN4_THATH|nr:hypothetical protein FRX31_027919 [Thalictrum thalictroides]